MSPPSNDPVSNGGSRQFWLFLLLIVLIVALVVYDHGAVRHYGQQAYSKAERATHKAYKWAKNLYACGIPGCGPKSGNVNNSPVQTGPGKMAVADPNTNTMPVAPNASATNTETAAGVPDTQAAPPENPATGDQTQASGVVNYPAYPSYPAYPNYPPDASFGSKGFGSDSTSPGGPPAETPPSPSAPVVASPPPALPYLPPSSAQATEAGGGPRQTRVPGLSGIPAEPFGRNSADDAAVSDGPPVPPPPARSAGRPECQRCNERRRTGSGKKVSAGRTPQ